MKASCDHGHVSFSFGQRGFAQNVLKFEVASIKPSDSVEGRGATIMDGSRVSIPGINLASLIMWPTICSAISSILRIGCWPPV